MADPQGNSGYLTELDIRIWMRDNNPELNLLLDDYEFSPEEIRTSMTLAVDKWNDTPPYMASRNMTVDNFPYRSMLLKGTAANLLFSAALRYRRNNLKIQISGGVVADQDKWQEYDHAGDRLWREYTDWVKSNKRAINMEEGWALIS